MFMKIRGGSCRDARVGYKDIWFAVSLWRLCLDHGKPEVITWLENALLVEVPEQLPCPHSTATRIIECPACRDGEPLRGKIPFPVLRNGIDDRRSRIPSLAEFAGVKTHSSGLITAKAGWSIRLSQSKESLVDETGIEPATSSLRTVGKIVRQGATIT